MTRRSRREIENVVDRLTEQTSDPRFGRPDELTAEEKSLLEDVFGGYVNDPYGESNDPVMEHLHEEFSE